MKKEEPSVTSSRGNPVSTEATTGLLSRPGLTATARTEQPALSRFFESSMVAVVGAPNAEPVHRILLGALA
jgi:hypothetical protein